jgi:hypothetical protein
MTADITWEDRAERKRQALATYLAEWDPTGGSKAVPKGNVLSYPTTCMSKAEVEITEMGPVELVEALKTSRLSSVEVTVGRRRCCRDLKLICRKRLSRERQ